MAVRVTTEPTIEPVTLAEAKLQARIDSDGDNLLIESLISTARKQAENLSLIHI